MQYDRPEVTKLRNMMETLRTENSELKEQNKHYISNNSFLMDENSELKETLSLIAADKRADGTWNRSREACRDLARKVLWGKE